MTPPDPEPVPDPALERRRAMRVLQEWTDAVALELDLNPGLDRTLLLDLARDAAHGVARPAAPLTTYLLGVAVGRGADPAEAAARLSVLAARWSR